MKDRTDVNSERIERIHISLPRWLHKKVKESAKNTDRSYSGMIITILKGVYGGKP